MMSDLHDEIIAWREHLKAERLERQANEAQRK